MELTNIFRECGFYHYLPLHTARRTTVGCDKTKIIRKRRAKFCLCAGALEYVFHNSASPEYLTKKSYLN